MIDVNNFQNQVLRERSTKIKDGIRTDLHYGFTITSLVFLKK